jgi:ketosteroid isomerase-like protein
MEEIRQLKATYCGYCDQGYDADRLAELFTRDAIWDGGERFGLHRGRDAIRAFFSGISERITLAAHFVTNPVIELHPSGKTAKGRWITLMPATMAAEKGPEAVWLAARYDDRYVRERDGWKFEQVRVSLFFLATHREGWAIA